MPNGKGQKWNHPLYNNDYLRKTNYHFLIERFKYFTDLFDLIRIDHFRAFSSFYAIPYDKSALEGKWMEGVGRRFLKLLIEEIGAGKLIAEDVGGLDKDTQALLKEFNIPGMNILEFNYYVKNYKVNKDNDDISVAVIRDLNLKIEKLKKELKDREYIVTEKDNLLALKEKRIEAMGNKISGYAKRNDELRSIIETQYKENAKLTEKVKEKELARRKNAGAIGGLKAKLNELKQDLERANQKITWLKTNQKAPTKEEIIAYETRMKEVEKRQKAKSSYEEVCQDIQNKLKTGEYRYASSEEIEKLNKGQKEKAK